MIDMEDLITAAQAVISAHPAENMHLPAIPSVVVEVEDLDDKIIEMEDAYAGQVYDAVVDHLYMGDERHRDVILIEYVWQQGEPSRCHLVFYHALGSFDAAHAYRGDHDPPYTSSLASLP